MIYDSDTQLVGAAVAHLRAGAERGEQLMIACTPRHTRLITAALGDGHRIVVHENGDTYPSPASALQLYLQSTRDAVASGAMGVCVVGELPPSTKDTPHTWPRWSRYEAVVNHAFATLPFNALCAYASSVDDSLLDNVRATHPHLVDRGARRVNGAYRSPSDLLRRWSAPRVLPIESTPGLVHIEDVRDRREAQLATSHLSDVLALSDTALQPFAEHLPPADPSLVDASAYVDAVGEVLDNALTHGRAPVRLRLWIDHDHVVTTVTDAGDGFDDPFMGYQPLGGSQGDTGTSVSSGLWRARQSCDDLSYRHDDDGFTVRLRADLDVRHG